MHELKAFLLNVFKLNDRSFHEDIIVRIRGRCGGGGGARDEKTQSFGQSFPSKKSLKKRFLDRFFSIICLPCRKFGQNRVFLVIWESSDNQFGRPNKRSTKFSIYLSKIRPAPREIPRTAPGLELEVILFGRIIKQIVKLKTLFFEQYVCWARYVQGMTDCSCNNGTT